MIRVIIADNHLIIHASLHKILDDIPDIEIVGEATTGYSTVELAKKMKPDVIIMELSIPDMNGFTAANRILKSDPDIKILVLSMHTDKWNVERAFKTGASGYLTKNCTIEELTLAIRTVHYGGNYVSPKIVQTVDRKP
jgi:DNA-binding NarL/FixJ family response regulator